MTNHEGTNHLSAFAFGLMFHRSWDDGKEHCGVVLLTVADPELRETDENYLPRLSGIIHEVFPEEKLRSRNPASLRGRFNGFVVRGCWGSQLVLNALRTSGSRQSLLCRRV